MFNKIELFFIDPAVMSLEKQIMMGHFTSNQNIQDESCFDLAIMTNGEKIVDISVVSEITRKSEMFSDYDRNNTKQDLKFINSFDLSFLMSNKQLKCYSTFDKNVIVSQVCLLKIPSLNEEEHSYLFFGFVNDPIVFNIHSKVFFKDDNGKINFGGDVKHKTGNSIARDFCYNYSFGFGKDLCLSSISSKEYLDGIEKYKNIIISGKNIDEETKKDLKKVFHLCGDEYFLFLKEIDKLSKKEGMKERMPFWMTKEENEKFNKIADQAIKNTMNNSF